MLVELLQPVTPDLARRWLAARLLVPREDRGAVVSAVERRIGELYPTRGRAAIDDRADEVDVINPATQREGYVEQVRTTYAPAETGRQAQTSPAGARRRKRA